MEIDHNAASPEGPPPHRGLSQALLGIGLGLALLVVFLVLAGAPPFNRVIAQAPAATPAVTEPPIAGAAGTYGLPVAASAHAEKVDFLFYLITGITGVAFVAVEVLLVLFALKYRHQPGRKATYIHGHRGLEIAWTVIPAVILAVLVFLSRTTWSQIRYGAPPADSTEIEVTAQQFQWNVKYLNTAERFGKTSDLFTVNNFYVPINKPVSVFLKSRDVLHSFFLPNMRVKLDAVPGMTGRPWFTPTMLGTFELVCAELCGIEHWKMRGTITVVSQEEFDKWLDSIKIYVADKPKQQ